MGKGDRRTKHGKICNGSYGKARPRRSPVADAAAASKAKAGKPGAKKAS